MPIKTTPTSGAKLKPKYNTNVKPKLAHAETAIHLAKVKLLAEKTDNTEGEEMYVFAIDGTKITL